MTYRPHSTSWQFHQPRRGVALLLVLAVLIITLPVAVVVARQAGTNRLASSTLQATKIADELRTTYENDFIRSWLQAESANVVLPPDLKIPAIEILDEHWQMPLAPVNDQVNCRIQITAFDQAGMVPIGSARPGSPLRLALPAEVLAQLDQLNLSALNDKKLRCLGLDAFSTIDPTSFANSSSPFPTHDAKGSETAIGSYLATTEFADTTININTAPLALLEIALRTAGRAGGINAIITARTQIKPASLNTLSKSSRTSNNRNEHQINFASTSTSWAFRIDIEAAGITRAWWCIYQLQPSNKSHDKNPWKCVQRLAINH